MRALRLEEGWHDAYSTESALRTQPIRYGIPGLDDEGNKMEPRSHRSVLLGMVLVVAGFLMAFVSAGLALTSYQIDRETLKLCSALGWALLGIGGFFARLAQGVWLPAVLASGLALSTSGLLFWSLNDPPSPWPIPLAPPMGTSSLCLFAFLFRRLGEKVEDGKLELYAKWSVWCVGGGFSLGFLAVVVLARLDLYGYDPLRVFGQLATSGSIGGAAFFAVAGLRAAYGYFQLLEHRVRNPVSNPIRSNRWPSIRTLS